GVRRAAHDEARVIHCLRVLGCLIATGYADVRGVGALHRAIADVLDPQLESPPLGAGRWLLGFSCAHHVAISRLCAEKRELEGEIPRRLPLCATSAVRSATAPVIPIASASCNQRQQCSGEEHPEACPMCQLSLPFLPLSEITNRSFLPEESASALVAC